MSGLATGVGLAMPTGAELHLWLAPEIAPLDAEQSASFCALLNPAERATWTRFRFEADRQRYLLTRALQRHVLSSYAPHRLPADWRFLTGERGKPSLADGPQHLQFNLSHTRGLVAMVVGANHALGVDVESTVTRKAPLDVADRYFTADEARDLRALPLGEQQARFFALWTLKESYIKALGGGVAVPLNEVSFRFEGSSSRVSGYEARADQARGFHFWQFEIEGAAIAVATRAEGRGAIHVREFLPGKTVRSLSLEPLAAI